MSASTSPPGEILCLVGDNGAGKSTVVTMLSGAITPDAGTIEVGGHDLAPGQPAAARGPRHHDGVSRSRPLPEPRRRREPHARTRADDGLAAEFSPGVTIAPPRRSHGNDSRFSTSHSPTIGARSTSLSGGQRQAVAIARAAEPGARVVILDEPTAALGRRQTESVLSLVRTPRCQRRRRDRDHPRARDSSRPRPPHHRAPTRRGHIRRSGERPVRVRPHPRHGRIPIHGGSTVSRRELPVGPEPP